MAAAYGGIVAWFMYDPAKSARWRQVTWLVFSIVFFSQLILGLFVSEKFLMTGKLHLPIPVMILSGPMYRGEFSVMTILFLSTILLSGPAWCSHFCYFGALDGLGSGSKKNKGTLGNIWSLKIPLLLTIILVTILLRILKIDLMIATWIAVGFAIVGLGIILFISRKKGKMVHCLVWCPIGTLVSGLKHINPMRLKFQDSCTSCMTCTSHCKYDALRPQDIEKRKPAPTCTLCGDCITSCPSRSLQYKLFSLSPSRSGTIYLGITVALHAMTMVLAKI
ncbi:MAG: 4Fe-4S binding protein [Bacteroidales bacterium]|nr:4Fe-4S binding protein [Bacteroidales bacterium]